MLHFQTAAAGYRLDSQLSAPHRFMTLGSWTCKAGPPNRYRHIFLKLPNRRSFCLLTISIKKHNPFVEVGQAKQPLPQAWGWLLEFVEQGRFLHVKSSWVCVGSRDCLLVVFLFVSFGSTQWLQPLHRTKKRKTGNVACLFYFLFVSSFVRLCMCLLACLFVCLVISLCFFFSFFAFWWSLFR